jgi:hypothetical protein
VADRSASVLASWFVGWACPGGGLCRAGKLGLAAVGFIRFGVWSVLGERVGVYEALRLTGNRLPTARVNRADRSVTVDNAFRGCPIRQPLAWRFV